MPKYICLIIRSRTVITQIITLTLIVFLGCSTKLDQEILDNALDSAVRHGPITDIRGWLSKGANPNVGDSDGNTPLMFATYRGHDVVRILLDNGADVNLRNKYGMNALCFALAGRKTDIKTIQLLLDRAADVTVRTTDGITPLMVAAEKNEADIVRLFLDKGADINATDRGGRTALIKAVSERHPEIVKLLLSKGANTSVRSNGGDTALNTAKRREYSELVEMLESAGALE